MTFISAASSGIFRVFPGHDTCGQFQLWSIKFAPDPSARLKNGCALSKLPELPASLGRAGEGILRQAQDRLCPYVGIAQNQSFIVLRWAVGPSQLRTAPGFQPLKLTHYQLFV
jgi:hypothetical protein